MAQQRQRDQGKGLNTARIQQLHGVQKRNQLAADMKRTDRMERRDTATSVAQVLQQPQAAAQHQQVNTLGSLVLLTPISALQVFFCAIFRPG
ncbi:hypothetical protein WJX77_004195 [Trebouxia sp. C0004]